MRWPTRLGRLSPLYSIFVLILGAAIGLGRSSYQNARLLADQSELSLGESNRLLGEQFRQRIETFIIDSDNSLLDIVDLEHLKDFAGDWKKIVGRSQSIEAAIVLDERQEIVKDAKNGIKDGYVTRLRGQEADIFRERFMKRIKPQLDLDHLALNLHKHLHFVDQQDGKDYLISYMKREQSPTASRAGGVYFVALKINLDYLVKEFFPAAFHTAEGRELYAVVDDNDRLVFGKSFEATPQLLYDEHFPTTLYKWRLQMAPPDAARLAAEMQKKRVSDTVLIALMVATILVGIGFLIYAVNAERRANQLKSEFISNVSHELKTPLSLIRMFGELLALNKVKSAETGREYAEIITRESERLSRLIDNVLDFSRIERGKVSYDFQPGDLSEVVARAIDVYKLRFEREGWTLATDIDEDLPEILFDESSMTLVLLNLLDNAMKYGAPTPTGGPAARAAGDVASSPGRILVRLKRDGIRVRLSVRDYGPGIPRDEQKRIFNRFYRSAAARSQNARGSGIGLSLVKHIAEAHGGRVTVDSEPGKGATFTVAIPMLVPPHHAGPQEEAA